MHDENKNKNNYLGTEGVQKVILNQSVMYYEHYLKPKAYRERASVV